jgi:hypothetical protein
VVLFKKSKNFFDMFIEENFPIFEGQIDRITSELFK